MISIDKIIQRELNPFDPVTLYTINFWQEQQIVVWPPSLQQSIAEECLRYKPSRFAS